MNATQVTLASKYTSKSYTTQSKRTVNMFMLTVDIARLLYPGFTIDQI